MNKITLQHPEAHEKLTAKLFWKLAGASGYNDAGNVKDYSDLSTRATVTRARSQSGVRHVGNEQADVCQQAFSFTLDERVPEQEALIQLAKDDPNQTQESEEGATATIEAVAQGKWFEIGSYNIANVTVSASVSGACEEGTDYDIETAAGRIFVKRNAGISNGEDLLITFDRPGFDMEKRTSQKTTLFRCDIILEEHNQYSRVWLRRLTFTAYLNATEFPTQIGEFSQYKVKATASGPVNIVKRPEGQTLPEFDNTLFSSSSASSSSASSRSSHSSQSYSSSSSSQNSSSSYSSPNTGNSSSSSDSSSSSLSSDNSSSSHSISSNSSSSTAQSYSSSSSSTSGSTGGSYSSSSSSGTNP